jgi:hypothetical protein
MQLEGGLLKGGPALGFLLYLLLAATPAAADWLVTRAGARVETKGSWQIKGKLVVFTRADGSLASLRLSEVDLEASRKATEGAKAAAAAPPAPPPPKKKLAVLTDKDFPKAAKEGSKPAEAAEEAKEAAAASQDTKPPGTVSVSSWKRLDRAGGDGIEIQGTLQNNTDQIAAGVAIEVELYDEAGARIATATGVLSTPSIQPRGTVEFRAAFPGVFAFAQAKFDTKGYPLDLSPAPDQAPQPDPSPQKNASPS